MTSDEDREFEEFKKTMEPGFFPPDEPIEKQKAYVKGIKARQRQEKADAATSRKKGFTALDQAVEKKNRERAGDTEQEPSEPESVSSQKDDDRKNIREIIVSKKTLPELTERSILALQADNDPPHIFVRAGGFVRIVHDEKGTPSIEICDRVILKHILARSADFRRWGKDEVRDISPPTEVVLDVLAARDWSGFPAIEGIIESPVILPEGKITASPGYYGDLRMQYIPATDLHLPNIPEHPSDHDIRRAVEKVKEPFEDFPFIDEASRTNTIAALITGVLRPVIPGFVPLTLIDKPQPGIGASLMTDVISVVATGRPPAKMTAPTDESEWRKLITARLTQGQGLIIIDNVDKRLVSSSLASVLTSETWNDRVLGQSNTITLTNHTVFIANGINVETGPDIARRVIPVRIDAKRARPDQRTDFHHPDLLEWVKKERGEILAAILTLTRAWIQAGSPPPSGIPQMGSFEKWRGMIGGILHTTGIPGFLGNLEQFRERSDTITSQWDSFLHALKEHFTGPFTTKDVKMRLEEYRDDQQTKFNNPVIRLCDVIPDDIPLRDKDPSRAIGRALGKRSDYVFPSGIVLRKDAKRHGVEAWRVEDQNEKRE